jgi:hypothetical protein
MARRAEMGGFTPDQHDRSPQAKSTNHPFRRLKTIQVVEPQGNQASSNGSAGVSNSDQSISKD